MKNIIKDINFAEKMLGFSDKLMNNATKPIADIKVGDFIIRKGIRYTVASKPEKKDGIWHFYLSYYGEWIKVSTKKDVIRYYEG